jgi:hypothetical protein
MQASLVKRDAEQFLKKTTVSRLSQAVPPRTGIIHTTTQDNALYTRDNDDSDRQTAIRHPCESIQRTDYVTE